MRVRTSRVTGWPTAAHMRRTMRLRPSLITSSSAAPPSLTPARSATRAGARRAVVELDAFAQPAQLAGGRDALDLGEVLLLARRGSDA